MTEQYFKVFKLKNGDLMAGISTKDITMNDVIEKSLIEISGPVIFSSFRFLDQDGELVETISMQPLLPVSDAELFQIRTDHVFSVASMREAAATRYVQFLEHLDKVKEEESNEEAALGDAAAELAEEETDNNVLDITKYTTKILH